MTSIFGGAQTVPQTQFTNQNYNQTQNSVQNQTQAQGYAANPLAGNLGQLAYNQALNLHVGGGNQPYAPLMQVAPLQDWQNAFINRLENAGAGAGEALIPAGQQAMISAGQAITPGDINSFLNPYQDYVTANLQNIFGQQNLANRLSGTAGTGGVGGERAAVGQSLLAKQQGLAAGQTYAGLYQSALQAAQQQKAQQLQAGQAALQGGFGAYGQGMQAASIPQAQQQAINQAQYQQLLGFYQDPFMRLAAETGSLPALAGLGGAGYSTASGTSQTGTTGAQTGLGNASTTYPAPSPISQIAGLGSLALGIGSIFSDKRDKTDIQKVGKDKGSGLPMYAYRYKGDPKTYPKVVGPMAQDVKKKYPTAVKKFAQGGSIPHFQYGGEDSGQQQQDTNYFDDYTDTNPVGGGMTAPYASEGSTWDPKRIFSADKMQRAARAISMANRMAQQAQTARPRVSPITFPQVPWKSGITFARGGRLAINLPALSAAVMRRQQEGGRVDAATADSWGGHKVWRPGLPKFGPIEGRTESPETGAPFVPDIPEKAIGHRTPMKLVPPRPGRYPMLDMRRSPTGVYQDGGAVDDDEVEPAGLPELDEDMVTGSPAGLPMQAGAGAVPLPTPRPPGAGAGAPMTDLGGGSVGLPQVGAGGQTLFGKPVSPGAMALIQAGLGMLAASGQRDARGLPMSGLGAIGAGGMAGINTYESMQNQQQKDLLARDTLAQRKMLTQARMTDLARARDEIKRHNLALEAARTGEDKPITVQTRYGPMSVVKQPDNTFREVQVDRGIAASAVPGAPALEEGEEPPAPTEQGAGFDTQSGAFNEDKKADAPIFPGQNPDALKTMDWWGNDAARNAEDAALVKAIANGRAKPLSLTRNNARNAYIMGKVRAFDPNFDETTYARRQRTENEFAVGARYGNNIVAMNTLATHMDKYKKLSAMLDRGTFVPWNVIQNEAARLGIPGMKDKQDLLAEIETTRKAISDEAARVFAGSGQSALEDRREWMNRFDPSLPKTALNQSLSGLTDLVYGRLTSLSSQYNQGTRSGHQPMDFLSPETRKIYMDMKGGAPFEPQKSPAASPKGGGWKRDPNSGNLLSPDGKWFTPDGKPL